MTGRDSSAEEPGSDLSRAADRNRSVEMLAAALRADIADLNTYAQVLTRSLVDALPAGTVELQRQRVFADRLAHRSGIVTLLRVHTETGYLELSARRNDLPEASIVTVVPDIGVARRKVTVAEWAHQLAEVLSRRARESAAARAALSELLEG